MFPGMLAARVCVFLFTTPPGVSLAAAQNTATVSVDVRGVERSTFENLAMADLYEALVVRLLEERVAVVSRDTVADLTVAWKQQSGHLVVEVSGAGAVRARRIAFPEESMPAWRLRVVHEMVDLVRRALDDLLAARLAAAVDGPAEKPVPPAPSTSLEPAARRAVPLPAAAQSAVELAVGPAALGLGAYAEAGGEVSASWLLRARWGPRLALTVARPLWPPQKLAVTEAVVRAGPAVRLGEPSGRFRAGFVAGAGVLMHTFRYQGEQVRSDHGTRWDALVDVQGLVGFRLGAHLAMDLQAGVLLTRRAREHRAGERLLWRSASWRAVGGLVLVWLP